MARTVWITGAHGFIGRHLARHQADAGASVAGLGHGAWSPTEAASCGVSSWVNGDVRPGNLQSLLSATGRPDCIFHLAGGSSVGAAAANPLEAFDRTVATTAELLDWVRTETPQTAVVGISSAAVYGISREGPISETSPIQPISFYGRHKAMMESLFGAYAAEFDAKVVIARLFSVYGSGLKKQLLWDLSAKIAAGNPPALGGSGAELRDWTDVRDVVRALDLVSQQASPSAPVFNVGSGIGTTVRSIADLVLGAWPSGHAPIFNGAPRAGDPFSLVADNTALTQLGFDWRVRVERGIADYVGWSRGQL